MLYLVFSQPQGVVPVKCLKTLVPLEILEPTYYFAGVFFTGLSVLGFLKLWLNVPMRGEQNPEL